MRLDSKPWFFIALVTVAIGISYFDRQALPVAISAIQRNIPISDAQFALLQAAFLATYALLYAGGGRFLDTIGTKVGFAISMAWWSAACALHGFARGLPLLVLARLLLGMGEGAAFPAATRVVAEWLPANQRATAMGIINAGTALGSVLAPPLIGVILLFGSWRYIFFFAAALGLTWAVGWLVVYPQPVELASRHPVIEAARIPWLRLLSSRRVLGMVSAKFLSDSAWFSACSGCRSISTMPGGLISSRSATSRGFLTQPPVSAASLEAGFPAICYALAALSTSRASCPWV